MSRARKPSPDVRIGDVWQDMEAAHRFDADRHARVIGFSDKDRYGRPGDFVVAVDTQTGRKTLIRLSRMRPTKNGWRLVERDGKPVEGA